MQHRARTVKATVAAAAGVALLGLAPVSAAPASGSSGEESLRAFGLTRDQRLVTFRTDDRSAGRVRGGITGLGDDSRVLGIDVRPENGKLYGLGDDGGVYRINKRTAHATHVAQVTVALDGNRFGVDFNPTVDLLRIVSDTGQNLRQDVDLMAAGTTVDTSLTYPATATTPVIAALGVTAAAYTNNDTSADSGTTLYDIDTSLDQVVIQAPANAGLLSATGKLTVDAGPNAGLDIYSKVVDGKAAGQFPYAVLSVDGRFGLYDVRLSNGEVSREFTFPRGRQVTDLAFPLGQL